MVIKVAKEAKSAVVRRIARYLFRYKATVLFCFLLMMTSNLLALVSPKLSGNAIDAIEGGAGKVDFDGIYKILMHLRKISKQKGEISLDEPLNIDYEGNKLLLSDILGTDPEIVYKNQESFEERKILKSAIDKLSFREKQIMSLRYGLGGEEELTQKEVADLLGISQSYISRLEKKIVDRLKKEFRKFH